MAALQPGVAKMRAKAEEQDPDRKVQAAMIVQAKEASAVTELLSSIGRLDRGPGSRAAPGELLMPVLTCVTISDVKWHALRRRQRNPYRDFHVAGVWRC